MTRVADAGWTFPPSEYRRRADALRMEARENGLEALLLFSSRRGHVTWLSGYRPDHITNQAAVLLPVDGEEPTLFVRFAHDLPTVRRTSWLQDVVPFPTPWALAEEVGKRFGGRRLGIVASDLAVSEWSWELAEAFRVRLPGVELVPCPELALSLRAVKSDAEVELLRRASAIAEASAKAARERCRLGVTDFAIAAAAEGTARELGVDRCLALVSVSPEDPVAPPYGRRVGEQAVLNLEISLALQGYWTQINRSYGGRGTSPTQREFLHVALAACAQGREAARPGARVADVANRVLEVVDRLGRRLMEFDLGHGVGADTPDVFFVREDEQRVLVPNTVFVLHVGLRLPGVAFAFVGAPLVVGSEGAAWLTPLPSHDACALP